MRQAGSKPRPPTHKEDKMEARLMNHPRILNLAADCQRLTMAALETRVRHEARILLADPCDIWDILPEIAEPPMDDPERGMT